MTARQRKEWRDGLLALLAIVGLSALALYAVTHTASVARCFQ